MNANVNTYFERRTNSAVCDSDAIRRRYLSNERKNALATAIDSAVLWYLIFAMKIIGGIVCAVSFFSVLGMIETGALSPVAGILCTVLITLLECLCFVPTGKRPTKKRSARR